MQERQHDTSRSTRCPHSPAAVSASGTGVDVLPLVDGHAHIDDKLGRWRDSLPLNFWLARWRVRRVDGMPDSRVRGCSEGQVSARVGWRVTHQNRS